MTDSKGIDLRKKDRDGICALAKNIFPQGTEIWAYGSRVKGTNHDTSDLDLVIHFPKEQDQLTSLSQLDDFVEALKESNIPIVVQALSWGSIPDSFRDNILRHHSVLLTIS